MPAPRSGLAPDARLRSELVALLRSGAAHVTPADALADIPFAHVHERPDGFAHSLWDLVYHLHYDQRDIFSYFENPDHAVPDTFWPDGPATPERWEATRTEFLRDLESLVARVEDPATDLFAEVPHAPGFTILREVFVVADHNAYHLGQVVQLRKALGLWPV